MRLVSRKTLSTARLRLRPSVATDAGRAFEIQSDWDVTRMLSMASYPPLLDEMTSWFNTHEHEWKAGSAYRFTIHDRAGVIGLIDLDAVSGEEATLGYWIERSAWGQGLTFEAAQAVLFFATEELGLRRVRAGHAADNPASGRILTKLGFHLTDKVVRHSTPRGTAIEQWRYVYDVPLLT